MFKQKRIVIDIDGILASWNQPAHDLLVSLGADMRPFGDPGDPTCWNWPEHYGATKQQVTAMWDYLGRSPNWWGSLPRHVDFNQTAKDKLWELVNEHEVTFVTSRPCGRDATASWLKNHLPYLYPHVILTPHRKVEALIALEPDVVIEDNDTTLAVYAWERNKLGQSPCELILVNRPYNTLDMNTKLSHVETTLEALEVAGA